MLRDTLGAVSCSQSSRATNCATPRLFNYGRPDRTRSRLRARSPRGSDMPPACHSLPLGRSLPATSWSQTRRATICATSRFGYLYIISNIPPKVNIRGKIISNFRTGQGRKKEVTLDCKHFLTIKGHFCSFLVSNVIWSTSLSQSTFYSVFHNSQNTFSFSLTRIPFVFVCVRFAKGECCLRACPSRAFNPNMSYNSLIYVQTVPHPKPCPWLVYYFLTGGYFLYLLLFSVRISSVRKAHS